MAPRSVSFLLYPLAVVIETMPPTLIESAVTPRVLPGAAPDPPGEVPLVEAELQAETSARAAAAAARVRIGRNMSGIPSGRNPRILCVT